MDRLTDKEKQLLETLKEKGWGILSPPQYQSDFSSRFRELWDRVAPYTMTSPERGWALHEALLYLEERAIPGDVVECGVWKGGSSLLAALTLLTCGSRERRLYLYDTFEGMPEPGEEDKIAYTGEPLRERWQRTPDWWAVDRDEVADLLESSGYPAEKLTLVKGDVAQTLGPDADEPLPEKIALLRLDTDWYASTKGELEVLYPRLVTGGVLIIDDYGHFEGARRAVDEYFASGVPRPLFSRTDYTGRMAVKG